MFDYPTLPKVFTPNTPLILHKGPKRGVITFRKGTNIMSHFKSVQTGVFRRVVAVSWKFAPSMRPTTLRLRDVTRVGTHAISSEIVRLGWSWATDRCVQLSSYGKSSNGMRAQLPYSVRSLQYGKCGVLPTLQLSRNDSIFVWTVVFKDEYFMKRRIEIDPKTNRHIALLVLHVPAYLLQASTL